MKKKKKVLWLAFVTKQEKYYKNSSAWNWFFPLLFLSFLLPPPLPSSCSMLLHRIEATLVEKLLSNTAYIHLRNCLHTQPTSEPSNHRLQFRLHSQSINDRIFINLFVVRTTTEGTIVTTRAHWNLNIILNVYYALVVCCDLVVHLRKKPQLKDWNGS